MIAGTVGVLVCIAVFTAEVRRARTTGPEIATAPVTRGPLESWISTNGVIEPAEPQIIRARVPTFVDRVRVVEGQVVKAHDILLTTDRVQQLADLARAREELAKAENDLRATEAGGPAGSRAEVESELRKAEADVAHLEGSRDAIARLVEKQAATREELRQADLELAKARATRDGLAQKRRDLDRDTALALPVARLAVQRAREAVALRESQAESAEIRASISGTIYSLPVHPGDRVDVGAVLVAIADLRAVRLRAFVDEPELASIHQGEGVEVAWSALPGRTWIGQVEQAPKEVVSRGDRKVGEVLASIDNQGQTLIPNLGVDVRIRVQSRPDALLVPREAVRTDASGRYVFVAAQSGQVRRQAIVVDIASASSYSVVEGLKEGDQIALPSDLELRDGMHVTVVPAR